MAAYISLLFLTVQAVPTLLSCLAFTSFSPLFFVSSFPFSSLFVSLSLCISLASWCAAPLDGALLVDGEAQYGVCHRPLLSSKLRTRSWWCCRQAPRGFQLAMLFLTWSLLLLLLCMPSLAGGGNDRVEPHTHQSLGHLGDCDPLSLSNDPACEVGIPFVSLRGSIEVEAASQSLGADGGLKKQGDLVLPIIFTNQKLDKIPEEQERQQESSDSSLAFESSGMGSQGELIIPVTANSGSNEGLTKATIEGLQCRGLLRAGTAVVCSPPTTAIETNAYGSLDVPPHLGDKPSSFKAFPSSAPDVLIVPPKLDLGQQPLYQPVYAPFTIINRCNSSGLTVHTTLSDDWQFLLLGFKESVVPPGGKLSLLVVYIPQSVGIAEGWLAVETSAGQFAVKAQGEGLESPYKLQLKRTTGEKVQHIVSLYNPFNEAIIVEEVSQQERPAVTVEALEGEPCLVTEVTTDRSNELLSEDDVMAEEGSTSKELLLGPAGPWEIEPHSSQDVIELFHPSREHEYDSLLHIRISRVSSESGDETLVFPVGVHVGQPSTVRPVPAELSFVGDDRASTQPLVLFNSGNQLLQIEEVYEISGDAKVSIEFVRGLVLVPLIETEVAKVTYKGLEDRVLSVPCNSHPCEQGQRIMVRTNSTIYGLIEIPYRAPYRGLSLLEGLECSPPSMGFVTESTGGVGANLSSHMLEVGTFTEYGKLFLGFLCCALLLGILVFFRMFVQDTVLPTLAGEPAKCSSQRKGSSRRSSLLGTAQSRNQDRLSKLRGLGALAAVADGIAAILGSESGEKDCSKSSSQLNLPHIRVKVPNSPLATLPQMTKSNGEGIGTKDSGSGGIHGGGRKAKPNGAARSDYSRNVKVAAEPPDDEVPVSIMTPLSAAGATQVKTSKSPKPAVSPGKPSIFEEGSTEQEDVQQHGVPAPTPVSGLVPESSVRGPQKTGTTPFRNALAQKLQPVSPRSQNSEREKSRRKKKRGQGNVLQQDSRSSLSTGGHTSPPASPATPASPSRPVSPLSSSDGHSTHSTSSFSDQSSASLSPTSKRPTTLKNLDVEGEPNTAPAFVRPESLSVDVASTALRQMAQAKVADISWQVPAKRDTGTGKRGNSNEWVAVGKKNSPCTGFAKGGDIEVGVQPCRGSSRMHRSGNIRGQSGGGTPALTPSATFPRSNSRVAGWNLPAKEYNKVGTVSGSSKFPAPAIAPSLRAPGAKITKQSGNQVTPNSDSANNGWSSLGFTANPELRSVKMSEKEVGAGSQRHSGGSILGQSSEELVYDIWGNHFGNLSHCSIHTEQENFPAVLEKEGDPVLSSFHRLLVPEQSESFFAGSAFAGDMSPAASCPFSPFSGFFSEVSYLGSDQSRPSSPAYANEFPGHSHAPPADQTNTVVPKLGVIGQVANNGTLVANVKPRVRVPYSPPMGGVSTVFSPRVNTPTAMSSSSSPRTSEPSCSFWSTGCSNLQERVPSPIPSFVG